LISIKNQFGNAQSPLPAALLLGAEFIIPLLSRA